MKTVLNLAPRNGQLLQRHKFGLLERFFGGMDRQVSVPNAKMSFRSARDLPLDV